MSEEARAGAPNNESEELEETRTAIELRSSWVDLEEVPILGANQFVSQFWEGTFFLSIGVLTPPVVLGSEEERAKQLRDIPFLPIQALGRYSLSRKDMEDLISVLQRNLERFDRAQKRDAENS